MIKNIKKLTMLLFVAATMFSLMSCNKDDVNNQNTNTSTNDYAAVADTEWKWMAEDPNSISGVISIRVEFNGPKLADLIYTDMSTGLMETEVLMGTYTYSNGSGTLALEDDDYNAVNVSFTISGTTMTLKFKGATYTLTKQ